MEFTSRRSASRTWGAMMRKNFKLKSRGCLCCCTVVEIVMPICFFALMCLPKFLIDPLAYNTEFFSEHAINAASWLADCPGGTKLHYSPDTDLARDVARDAMRRLTCDAHVCATDAPRTDIPPPSTTPGEEEEDEEEEAMGADGRHSAARSSSGTTFMQVTTGVCSVLDSQLEQLQGVMDQAVSMGATYLVDMYDWADDPFQTYINAFCTVCNNGEATDGTNATFCDGWLDEFVQGFATEEEAMANALLPENQKTVFATIALPADLSSADHIKYTIRTNGTVFRDEERGRFDGTKFTERWDNVSPNTYWRNYWAFMNVQNAFDAAIISSRVGARATISSCAKMYPWPDYELNLAGLIAANFLPLIFIFAFLSTTTLLLKSLVAEKELRLREGMQMMGLQSSMYWLTWFCTHFSTLMITMLACTVIGIYPFAYTDTGLMFVFLVFWAISLIMFCYFLSTLFNRSQVASVIGSLVYFLGLALAITVQSTSPKGSGLWTFVCLHPACCVYFWGEVLARFEIGNEGLTTTTMAVSIASDVEFTGNTVLGMTIFNCFLYAFLAWYLDKVFPKELGIRYPAWFLCTRSYWQEVGLLKATTPKFGPGDDEMELGLKEEDALNVEALSPEQEETAMIRVTNLRRTFGPVVAVDGLTLSFASNQISCLLGHNGAGKTTTIAMLTGTIPPTSGGGHVCGYDITTNMAEIRNSLGVCPQFDILWPSLTVAEHAEVFAAFQGVPKEAMATEVDALVHDVGLADKRNALTMTLSGGQKRKLSVVLAFMGRPKVVFLDEPTSGMDPHSRRMTWDIIRKYKSGRAIVLTTHFMDEADLLSDRIAIMTAGKMACMGSSVFLKKRFGLGFSLTMVKTNDQVDIEPVQQLVSKHIDGSKPLSNVGTEFSLKLPSAETSKFADMLEELERKQAELGIGSYGISATTLEEVFLRVAQGKGYSAAVDAVAAPVGALKPTSAAEPPVFLRGGELKVQQFKALMTKRLLNLRRDYRAVFTQLLGPVLFVLVALSIQGIQRNDGTDTVEYPSVALDRQMVANQNPFLFVSDSPGPSANDYIDAYQKLHGYEDTGADARDGWDTLASRSCFCPSDQYDGSEYAELEPEFNGECVTVEEQYEVDRSCESTVTNTVDWYLMKKEKPFVDCTEMDAGCDGLFINSYDRDSLTFNHTVLFHPSALHSPAVGLSSANSAIWNLLNDKTGSITVNNHPMDDPRTRTSPATDVQALVVCIFLGVGMSILSASFSSFLVAERMNNAKHLQMVSGVDKVLFWVTSYLSDLINYLMPFTLIFVCFAAFNQDVFTANNGLAGIAMLLLFFGVSAIPLSYLCHFPFKTPMNSLVAQIAGLSFLNIGSLVTSVVLEAIPDADSQEAWKYLKWLFRLFPHYSLCRGVYDLSVNQQLSNCESFMGRVCQPMKGVFDLEVTGYPLLFMALLGPAMFALTLLVELSESIWLRHGSAPPAPTTEDVDVTAERAHAMDDEAMRNEVLVVRDLCKTYPNGNMAVQRLAFSVGFGECFGLLGINGAGKTSTFRMLTGEFAPSDGNATVRGRADDSGAARKLSIKSDLNEARKVMGYCPQFDGIQPNMTAREHLRFYAMIRGVPPASLEHTVDQLLTRMDLVQYADRQAGGYSGGNKRKLSVGIALVGDPPLVLLDEPSTGMDPEARRFMWDVISTTMQHRCVVLTSHSMEECEALCQKVGIMVKGEFKCIGSIQHLKSRFGEGYNLDFTVPHGLKQETMTLIAQKLPMVALVEDQEIVLKYRVPPGTSIPQMFRLLEALAGDFGPLGVEHSLTQTTLEQVFVKFAEENPLFAGGAVGVAGA